MASGSRWDFVERAAWRLALVAVLLLGSVPSVQGSHSVPNFGFFWDLDDDGVAEAADSAPKFQKAGNLWNATKEGRFDLALKQWRDATDFNPAKVVTSVNGVYVDGRIPFCEESWSPGVVAANCVSFVNRATYLDIFNSRIYLNEANFNFSFDDDPPGPGLYDGQGVLTHELGHAILLLDLSCSPGPTMCGGSTAAQSFHLRSLSQDDKDGANAVYLP